MNYPKAWLILGKAFVLHQEETFLWFCVACVLVFWAACARVIYRYPSLYTLAFPFSFSSLLAVERGNTDLVLVGPMFFAFSHSVLAGLFVVVLGTVLKIYPCFSAAALVSRPRLFGLTVLLTGFYLLTQISDIQLLKSLTPQSGWWSYGAVSTSLVLEPKLKFLISPILIQAGLLVITACFVFWLRKTPMMVGSQASPHEKQLFLAGAGIYVGTFFFASNWDYRMVFLLLCLPFLAALRCKAWRHFSLLLVLLATNQIYLLKIPMDLAWLANVAAKSALFVVLAGLGLNLFLEEWKFGAFQSRQAE